MAKFIRAFENAVRVHEVKGSHHPDDWDDIEQTYQRAKKRLVDHVNKLEAHAAVMNSGTAMEK